MLDKDRAIRRKYPDLIQAMDYKDPGDYYLKNDGRPNEIFEWRTDKYPEPSVEDLEQWDSDFSYIDLRKYEAMEKQMDKLWHDIDSGLLGEPAKTGSWYLSVKDVKDKSPKSK